MSTTSIYVLPPTYATTAPVANALHVDDRERFKPSSFIAARDIELLQGTFDIPGADTLNVPSNKPVKSAYGWFTV